MMAEWVHGGAMKVFGGGNQASPMLGKPPQCGNLEKTKGLPEIQGIGVSGC